MLLKLTSYIILSLTALGIVGLVALPMVSQPGQYLQPVAIEVSQQYEEGVVPSPTTSLESDSEVKIRKTKKTIVLEDRNVVTLRGPVTGESTAQVMNELQEKSLKLPNNKPIYLFIDSPGGSVFAGLEMIDFAEGLPQPVHTITLFSASMAFQTVQALNKRYILRQGTLMSHRGRGGIEGQFDGELETRYKMVKRKLDYMDAVAAKRMSLSLKDYKAMIKDEYWIHGFDAVGDQAADEMVLARCGKSMKGTEIEEFRSLFGTVKVTFSKCPLISGPLKVDFGNAKGKTRKYLKYVFKLALEDKEEYVKKFIVTNKYKKVFGE